MDFGVNTVNLLADYSNACSMLSCKTDQDNETVDLSFQITMETNKLPEVFPGSLPVQQELADIKVEPDSCHRAINVSTSPAPPLAQFRRSTRVLNDKPKPATPKIPRPPPKSSRRRGRHRNKLVVPGAINLAPLSTNPPCEEPFKEAESPPEKGLVVVKSNHQVGSMVKSFLQNYHTLVSQTIPKLNNEINRQQKEIEEYRQACQNGNVFSRYLLGTTAGGGVQEVSVPQGFGGGYVKAVQLMKTEFERRVNEIDVDRCSLAKENGRLAKRNKAVERKWRKALEELKVLKKWVGTLTRAFVLKEGVRGRDSLQKMLGERFESIWEEGESDTAEMIVEEIWGLTELEPESEEPIHPFVKSIKKEGKRKSFRFVKKHKDDDEEIDVEGISEEDSFIEVDQPQDSSSWPVTKEPLNWECATSNPSKGPQFIHSKVVPAIKPALEGPGNQKRKLQNKGKTLSKRPKPEMPAQLNAKKDISKIKQEAGADQTGVETTFKEAITNRETIPPPPAAEHGSRKPSNPKAKDISMEIRPHPAPVVSASTGQTSNKSKLFQFFKKFSATHSLNETAEEVNVESAKTSCVSSCDHEAPPPGTYLLLKDEVASTPPDSPSSVALERIEDIFPSISPPAPNKTAESRQRVPLLNDALILKPLSDSDKRLPTCPVLEGPECHERNLAKVKSIPEEPAQLKAKKAISKTAPDAEADPVYSAMELAANIPTIPPLPACLSKHSTTKIAPTAAFPPPADMGTSVSTEPNDENPSIPPSSQSFTQFSRGIQSSRVVLKPSVQKTVEKACAVRVRTLSDSSIEDEEAPPPPPPVKLEVASTPPDSPASAATERTETLFQSPKQSRAIVKTRKSCPEPQPDGGTHFTEPPCDNGKPRRFPKSSPGTKLIATGKPLNLSSQVNRPLALVSSPPMTFLRTPTKSPPAKNGQQRSPPKRLQSQPRSRRKQVGNTPTIASSLRSKLSTCISIVPISEGPSCEKKRLEELIKSRPRKPVLPPKIAPPALSLVPPTMPPAPLQPSNLSDDLLLSSDSDDDVTPNSPTDVFDSPQSPEPVESPPISFSFTETLKPSLYSSFEALLKSPLDYLKLVDLNLSASLDQLVLIIFKSLVGTPSKDLCEKTTVGQGTSRCLLIPRYLKIFQVCKALQNPALFPRLAEYLLFHILPNDNLRDFEDDLLLEHIGRFLGAFTLDSNESKFGRQLLLKFCLHRGPFAYPFAYGLLCSDSSILEWAPGVTDFSTINITSKAIIYFLCKNPRFGNARKSIPVVDLIKKSLRIPVPDVTFHQFFDKTCQDVQEGVESMKSIDEYANVLGMCIVALGGAWVQGNLHKILTRWSGEWMDGRRSDAGLISVVKGVDIAIRSLRRSDLVENYNAFVQEFGKLAKIQNVPNLVAQICSQFIQDQAQLPVRSSGQPVDEWNYPVRGGTKRPSGAADHRRRLKKVNSRTLIAIVPVTEGPSCQKKRLEELIKSRCKPEKSLKKPIPPPKTAPPAGELKLVAPPPPPAPGCSSNLKDDLHLSSDSDSDD